MIDDPDAPDCRGGLFAALWWCVVAWTLAVLAATVVWRVVEATR